MKKHLVALTIAALASHAHCEPAHDKLSQCLADATTGKDRKDLARWMIGGISQHPAMEDLASITKENVDMLNKQAAQVFSRLLLTECKDQLVAVAALDGDKAMGKAFEFLGRLAIQELMGDPSASAALTGFSKYVDQQKFAEILGSKKSQ